MQQDIPLDINEIARRLVLAETRIADLERKLLEANNINHAILQRIDRFIEVNTQQSQAMARGFERAETLHRETGQRLDGVEQRLDAVEANVATLIDAAKDHKAAIETLAAGQRDLAAGQRELAAGQRQIIELLTGGKLPRND